MKAFWAVFKNDLNRVTQHKSRIVLLLILTTGAIVAALFFNTKADVAGNIAFVLQGDQSGFESPYLNITILEEEPPLSELVSGRYDAIVTENGSGEFEIQTIKSDEFKQTVADVLSNPSGYHPDLADNRKVGTNILGFLIMFILMQGMTLMFLFAEDKERGQIRRVAASPVAFTGYLCAHSLFAFLFMLIPTMVILYVVKFILAVNIGFGFWEFLLLTSLLCAFATSFALFLNAIINKSDSANMLGSAISILTSVLAGSFYSFEKGNTILETVVKVLPQKSYLTLANGLETGAGINSLLPHFIYLLGLTLVFFLFCVIKTRKDYIRN